MADAGGDNGVAEAEFERRRFHQQMNRDDVRTGIKICINRHERRHGKILEG